MATVVPMNNSLLDPPSSPSGNGNGKYSNGNSKARRLPTLFAACFLGLAWFANNLALAWIHERVPATEPLPDLWFTVFPELPGAIRLTELLMICLATTALVVLVCHQHRWIVVRRVFFCAALCYTYRALAITIIQVPVPSQRTYCGPKTAGGIGVLLNRVANTFWSIGIEQLRPRDLCGDLIVSGHSISIFLAVLTFKQYSPRRMWPVNWLLNGMALMAVTCILLARKHYMIDVCLAYFLTTQTFWTYHSLAESWHSQNNLDRNSLSQTWWARLIPSLESDAPPPHLLHNRLQWPSNCPDQLRRLCY